MLSALEIFLGYALYKFTFYLLTYLPYRNYWNKTDDDDDYLKFNFTVSYSTLHKKTNFNKLQDI